MGVKSTYEIDRQTALSIILGNVLKLDNRQLSNILLEFEESYYRNYIVYEVLPNNDIEYPSRQIRSVEEFYKEA